MLETNKLDIEELLFGYFDKIKAVISADVWENILLNCTKNEIFILILLYRNKQVNMTQIAEYINVPLNTATGVVARMEKRQWVRRERSPEDKRVVTIALDAGGLSHMKQIMGEFTRYGLKIIEVLTPEEMQVVESLFDKVIRTLAESEDVIRQGDSGKTVKKIIIE